MDNLAMASRQNFDFEKNSIETMDLATLRRTHNENDIYGQPIRGMYHFKVIETIEAICRKYNLNYQVEEIFAAQNKNKTQPGVVVLPQIEQQHGIRSIESHVLRRVFTTIRIRDFETDELTTTLAVTYHQDGIQAAIGPCVKICHNQCVLSPERTVSDYGKNKVTLDQLFATIDSWLSEFETQMTADRAHIQRLKDTVVSQQEILTYIGMLTALRVAHDSFRKELVVESGEISAQSGADIDLYRRCAQTATDQSENHRLGFVQHCHRALQTGQDRLPCADSAKRIFRYNACRILFAASKLNNLNSNSQGDDHRVVALFNSLIMCRIKGKITTADYLSIENFNRLCDGLHQDGEYMWELYCRLAFCTALRGSDVLSLTWEEILDRESLDKIERKTNKIRRINFNSSVSLKISELYDLLSRPDKKSLVFININTNHAYSLVHINRLLKVFKVRYRLPIKAFSTHTFRKTFGRYVYESNGRSAESLILLNSIFRHSSIDITKVYIGIRQNEIDKVFNSITF